MTKKRFSNRRHSSKPRASRRASHSYPPAVARGAKSGGAHANAVRKFNADIRPFPGGPAMMELILLRADEMPRVVAAEQRGDSKAGNLLQAAIYGSATT